MSTKPRRKTPTALTEPVTLATVLTALDRAEGLSDTRLRDLKSATKRVAILLGNEPAAIPLDMAAISARLATINPAALGLTAKRWIICLGAGCPTHLRRPLVQEPWRRALSDFVATRSTPWSRLW